ncbi:MAG: hypothetical protein HY231_18255, partial [Acidobacteria bacterium]|nr:hypothetical protein [Acidobacteriota bacterium]
DATTLNLTRSTNTSSIANGLLTETEIKNGATSYAKSVISYVTAANAAGEFVHRNDLSKPIPCKRRSPPVCI